MFRTPKIFVLFFVGAAIGLASLVRFYQVGQIDMASSTVENCLDETAVNKDSCSSKGLEGDSARAFAEEVLALATEANISLKILHAMLGTYQMAHEKFEVDLEGLYESYNNIQEPMRLAQKEYDRLRIEVEEKIFGPNSDFRKLERLGGVTPEEKSRARANFQSSFKAAAAKAIGDLESAKKFQKKEMQEFVDKTSSILTEKLNVNYEQVVRKLVTQAVNSGAKGAVILFEVYLDQRIQQIQKIQREAEQRKVTEERSTLKLLTLNDLNSEAAFASTASMRCPADEYRDIDSRNSSQIPHRDTCKQGDAIDPLAVAYRDFLRACHRRGQGAIQCQ